LELVKEAINKSPLAFEYASTDIKRNKEVILQVIKVNIYIMEYVPLDLKRDFEFVKEIIKMNEKGIIYVDRSIKIDNNKMFELYKINNKVLKYCRSKFLEDIQNIENNLYLNFNLIYLYVDYIHLLSNRVNIIDHLYNNEDYEFIIHTKTIFDCVCANLDKYNKLIQYIIDIEDYQLIYNNEVLSNYIKDNYKIIIMNINDINTDYNEGDLKKSLENTFDLYKIIWI